ncbi:TolC family outer membrane protein [Frateuria defendens]|uniref:TolC family outer membrane protein n=1 Tax=Frateuria defendens TaxID=2219559 RepID=UPI00066FEBB3|nr:TolC family outer membrane protein [Frateuria defendens]
MRLKLLSLALALSAASLPGHGEDLLDAYREARANDPTLSQADATRLATREGVPQARALLLPQINASMGISQSSYGGSFNSGLNGVDGSGHSRTRTVNGDISQTVLDLGKISDLRAAHSQADAQDASYQAALQDLYARVTAAYFNVLTSQNNLVYAKANEDAYRTTYEQAEQRYKVGLSAITDLLQAKSYYEAARANTVSVQTTLNDAREALTQITGKPVGDLKILREELPMQPPSPTDEKAWVQEAAKGNPNILAQQYSVQAAERSIDSARAGHLPTINATLSRGQNTTWTNRGSVPSGTNQLLNTNGRYATTIGVTLQVPIFSGGATQSRVRQSIYQRDSAQDSLEITRRQVTRDTLNYYRLVIAGISQVESTKAAVDSAQKAVEATRAGFQVGTKTILDVLNSIQTLTSAQSSYSQARHQFVLDKLLLKQSAGNAQVSDLEAINALLQ